MTSKKKNRKVLALEELQVLQQTRLKEILFYFNVIIKSFE